MNETTRAVLQAALEQETVDQGNRAKGLAEREQTLAERRQEHADGARRISELTAALAGE